MKSANPHLAHVISSLPRHAGPSLNGTKTIEVRDTRLRSRVFVYETAPVSDIIGEYTVDTARFTHPEAVTDDELAAIGLSREELETYAKGKPVWLHWIINPIRYDRPVAHAPVYGPLTINTERIAQIVNIATDPADQGVDYSTPIGDAS